MAEGTLHEERRGPVTILYGSERGKYPQGNSLLVEGPEGRLVIDPSLGLIPRRGALPPVDLVLFSHCHEDHVAGAHLFPAAPWHVHEADAPGLRSLEGMLAIYGFEGEMAEHWRRVLVRDFHYRARTDVQAFTEGAVFDLGGGVRVRALHAPGHTRGHCVLWVEPGDLLYLGDIDLSSFGPYYGDAWSSLEDFERSLERVEALRPRVWATFHHVGVLDTREAFEARFGRFRARIGEREERLLQFLAGQPRTLEDIVRHRFVYRPGDEVEWADAVERRSMGMHLERLMRAGTVREIEPGLYATAP